MCSYCNKVKNEDDEFEYFLDEDLESPNGIIINSIDGALDLGDDDDPEIYISLWLGDKMEELIDAHVPIRYCPFCGEKLV